MTLIRYGNTMNQSGFSKTETLIIVALIIVFTGISVINLTIVKKRARFDGQLKDMHSDLLNYRNLSMLQKKRTAVWIGPNEYIFKSYSSLGENIANPASGTVVESRQLVHEIRKFKSGKSSIFDINTDRIEFDGRGLSYNLPNNRLEIIIWPVNLNNRENCLVVYPMRSSMGNMADATRCKPSE